MPLSALVCKPKGMQVRLIPQLLAHPRVPDPSASALPQPVFPELVRGATEPVARANGIHALCDDSERSGHHRRPGLVRFMVVELASSGSPFQCRQTAREGLDGRLEFTDALDDISLTPAAISN